MFSQGWWGILGLIGWAYGICSIIYLYNRGNIKRVIGFLIFFIITTSLGSLKLLGPFNGIIPDNGCHQAFVLTGVLTTMLLFGTQIKMEIVNKLLILIVLSLISIELGWFTNLFYIISKITATPPWLFYSVGYAVLFYVFLYYIIEIKGIVKIFKIIEPAGTATLTCYLIPYLIYWLIIITGFKWFSFFGIYPIGLLKSLIVVSLALGTTYLLGKIGIKLKI